MPQFTWLVSLLIKCLYLRIWGFPDGLSGKELAYNAREEDSIPGSGRFPGERNGSPLWYSSLGNPMDRGAWWVTVLGVAKELDTT